MVQVEMQSAFKKASTNVGSVLALKKARSWSNPKSG